MGAIFEKTKNCSAPNRRRALRKVLREVEWSQAGMFWVGALRAQQGFLIKCAQDE